MTIKKISPLAGYLIIIAILATLVILTQTNGLGKQLKTSVLSPNICKQQTHTFSDVTEGEFTGEGKTQRLAQINALAKARSSLASGSACAEFSKDTSSSGESPLDCEPRYGYECNEKGLPTCKALSETLKRAGDFDCEYDPLSQKNVCTAFFEVSCQCVQDCVQGKPVESDEPSTNLTELQDGESVEPGCTNGKPVPALAKLYTYNYVGPLATGIDYDDAKAKEKAENLAKRLAREAAIQRAPAYCHSLILPGRRLQTYFSNDFTCDECDNGTEACGVATPDDAVVVKQDDGKARKIPLISCRIEKVIHKKDSEDLGLFYSLPQKSKWAAQASCKVLCSCKMECFPYADEDQGDDEPDNTDEP